MSTEKAQEREYMSQITEFSYQMQKQTCLVDHNASRSTGLVPPGRNPVLDSFDEEVCDQ